MRENNDDRKGLSVPVEVTYLLIGYNFEVLLNRLKRSAINVYNVKKKGKKQLYITINRRDDKNFFAIAKELCYNIKKIKDGGRAYPLLYFIRHIGVFFGALVFIVTLCLSSDRIYSFSFIGTGCVYEERAKEILQDEGVVLFGKFSDIDLKGLSASILQRCDDFSFVSCTKRGNRLVVELVLANRDFSPVNYADDAMICDYCGVVESIKVYRGTQIVKVGDRVEEGDTLVSGFYKHGESVVKTGALAVVTILSQKYVRMELPSDCMEEQAMILAAEENAVGTIVSANALKETISDRFIYTVELTVRYVIKSG